MLYRFANFTLDDDRCELRNGAERIALEPQVFSVLSYLVQQRSRIVSRGDLITTIWNGRLVSDSTINSRIAAVRRVIGDEGGSQNLIRSFPRRGYRFIADVTAEAQAQDRAAPDVVTSIGSRASIVVLPFTNLSQDAEHEGLIEGLVDDITTALTQFRQLIVVPRSIGTSYKGNTTDVARVTRELNVRYALEGTLRKEGTRVRVNAQLVDSRTGANLWARRFEGDLGQGFQLLDRLTESVVGEVVTKLDQAEVDLHRRSQPFLPDAYSHVMRGTSFLYEWTPNSIEAALRQYRSAMQVDREFAPAYAMASYCYVQRQSYGLITDRVSEFREGVELAWRAADLGKNDAYALTRAAHAISSLGQDITSGTSLIEQAITLNPNLAAAWYIRGWLRIFAGDALSALSDLDHAMRLSPYDRLVFKIKAAMAYASFFTGQHDEASRLAMSAIRERPNYMTALRVAAASHAVAGRTGDSRVLARRMRDLDADVRLSMLHHLLPLQSAYLGRWADALKIAGMPD